MSPNPALLTWPGPVTTGGGGPLEVTYRSVANDTANSSTYTFADMPVGDAAAGRVIVVAIAMRALSAISVTGVTIGGIAASVDAQRTGADGIAYTMTLLARATVPTGTTATVVATFTTSGLRAICGAWTMNRAATVSGTAVGNAGTLTLSPDTGPVVIAAAAQGSLNVPSLTEVMTNYFGQSSEGNLGFAIGSSTASPATVGVSSVPTPMSVAVAYE